MVKIKICGLTRIQDIEYVNKYKPDYAGFVFAESKRKVTPYIARELIHYLSPDIKKVGVFVNMPVERVNEIIDICNLDIVQLHGDETPYYCTLIHKPVWKAILIKDSSSLTDMDNYDVDAILFDSFSKESFGGTGRVFDWNIAASHKINKKLILAGGISANNVNQAIEIFNPYCVDVSSGVESDGVKSEYKIKQFIETIRRNQKN